MRKTSLLLIVSAFGVAPYGNAQKNKKVKDNQKKEKKMENNFTGEQKKVFSTIEKKVEAF